MLAGLAAVAVLAVTALGWAGYRNLSGGITTSQALAGGPESVGGAQNILIMGLDSRLDQHGQPLPEDIYDALHAGDETVGGYNANVLIVLHLPGGNGPVSAVSVPRDDYVDLPGCPSGVCKGKIKQAYGLAYQQSMDSLSDNIAQSSREQKAREAGRKAEIDTVRRLLGVPIDHFIEVTLGAFFQIARVVQPITSASTTTPQTATPVRISIVASNRSTPHRRWRSYGNGATRTTSCSPTWIAQGASRHSSCRW